MFKKNQKYILGILFALFFLNIVAWSVVCNLNQSFLEVTFFDIGQGDSAFIKTPQGHQILIDGGPDNTILGKLGEEMPFYDRTIDLIILTHPHRDHLTGLLEVLRNYEVENILWTGVVKDSGEFKEWERLVEEEGSNIIIARAGQVISASTLSINILYPFNSLEGQEIEDVNNTSVFSRLVFGSNSFLFAGDNFNSVERKLLEKGVEMNSDVLKVGHHGSKTSTSKQFLEVVSPEVAVISAGKDNRYNHPHQQILDILEKYDTILFRTDLDGDIKIISNGNAISSLQN